MRRWLPSMPCAIWACTRRDGSRYVLNRDRFAATEELRSGVQATVEILRDNKTESRTDVQLCVSLPPSLSPAAEHVIHESSTDLRSSLLDVIASAKQSLIVASPFWDAGTTAEMVALARKKLAAGLQVSLLGRFSRELPAEVKSQLGKIGSDPGCAILSFILRGQGPKLKRFISKPSAPIEDTEGIWVAPI